MIKVGFSERNDEKGRLYMFATSLFGKERVPVCEYGHTEDEARDSANKFLVKGEHIGDLLEIDGLMVCKLS